MDNNLRCQPLENIWTKSKTRVPMVDTLLSFPFFWKPSKTCTFLCSALDCIVKHRNEGFLEYLESDSCKIWDPKPNWKKVFGEDDFRILTNSHDLYQPCNVRSVKNLLQLVINLYNDQEAFQVISKVDVVDEAQFVNYWNTKFPRLICFLWLKCHRLLTNYHSKLSEFYLDEVDYLSFGLSILNLDKFLKKLNHVLLDDKEQGGLQLRFQERPCNPHPFIIEFRHLSRKTIQQILNDHKLIKIELHQYYVEVSCDFDIRSRVHIISELITELGEIYPKTKTLIIADNDYINYENTQKCSTKSLLIFSAKENPLDSVKAQSLAKNFIHPNLFQQSPIEYFELGFQTKSKLLTSAKVKLSSKEIKLKDILPANEKDRTKLLSLLKGDTLNSLLAGITPSIFGKHKLQKVPNYYVERYIYKISNVNLKVLNENCNDIFIVSNISISDLKKKISDKSIEIIKCLGKVDIPIPVTKVILIEQYDDDDEHINTLLNKYSQNGRNTHFLNYVGNRLFNWLGSIGSSSIFNKHVSMRTEDAVAESQLVEHHKANEPILICDQSGMGTSMLLKKYSTILSENGHLTLFLEIGQLLSKLKSKYKADEYLAGVSNIITAAVIKKIIEEETCETDFERCILRQSFKAKSSERKLKIELMIENLNKLDCKLLPSAYEVLQFIKNKVSSVRIWIAVSGNPDFIENVQSKMGILGYKIQPIWSPSVQVNYIVKYWNSKNTDLSNGNGFKYYYENLPKHANQFLDMIKSNNIKTDKMLSVSGIPLRLHILADICEKQIGSRKKSEPKTYTIFELYNELVKKVVHNTGYLDDNNKENSIRLFEHYYMHMTLKYFLIESEILAKLVKLLEIPKNGDDFEEHVLKHGIIYSRDPPVFAHQTFADYFLALFVFKVVCKEIKIKVEDIETFMIFYALNFLDLHSTSGCSSAISDFKLENACRFFNEMLAKTWNEREDEAPKLPILASAAIDFISDEENGQKFEIKKSIVFAAIKNEFEFIARLLLKGVNNRNVFYKKLFNKMDLSGECKLDSTLFTLSIKCSLKFFEWIIATFDSYHRNEFAAEMQYSFDLLVKGLKQGNYKNVNWLIENKKYYFGNDRWSRLKDFGGSSNIINWVISGSEYYDDFDYEDKLNAKKELIDYFVKKDRNLLDLADDETGQSPLLFLLHQACLEGKSETIELVKYFIENLKADVNAIDIHNNTLIHIPKNFAAINSLDDFHELLDLALKHGFSRINEKNKDGFSPLLCVLLAYNFELKEESFNLFRDYWADFNLRHHKGKIILHYAVESDAELKVIEKLIDCGADILIKNRDGDNTVELANKLKKFKVVELLAEKSGQVKHDDPSCQEEGES